MMQDTQAVPAPSQTGALVLSLGLILLLLVPQAAAMQVQLPSATDDEGSSTESGDGKGEGPYILRNPPPDVPGGEPRTPVDLPDDRVPGAVADATDGFGLGVAGACTKETGCVDNGDAAAAEDFGRCNWSGRWKVVLKIERASHIDDKAIAYVTCGEEIVAQCTAYADEPGMSCDSGFEESGKGDLHCGYVPQVQDWDVFRASGYCADPVDPTRFIPATPINACLERSILDDPTLGFGCGLAPQP